MKQYRSPECELCLLVKEDIMTASGVGTVIDFENGESVDPGM